MEAQYRLGMCYSRGEGARKDAGQAAHWWRETAKLGSAIAQYSLGYCYARGEGVRLDLGPEGRRAGAGESAGGCCAYCATTFSAKHEEG